MDNYKKEQLCLKLSKIFTRLQYKINFTMRNTSSLLLPIDLLRNSIKHKLLAIVTLKIETLFLELLNNEKALCRIEEKSFFLHLVKSTTEEFLASFYGSPITIQTSVIKESFYTKSLLNEEKFLLFTPLRVLEDPKSKDFCSIFEPVYNTAYDSFIEALLDNLVLELANASMFFILNEFSFIYDIRKNFYRSTFLSLRNVERFRNNLSWQIRFKRFITRPANIYNNQQGIWVIRTTGIYYRIIYANRSIELLNLDQLSIVTVIGIEAKDFLISRVDELGYIFGNTIRYTFTSIFGQFIGLVWRGIIEGLKK